MSSDEIRSNACGYYSKPLPGLPAIFTLDLTRQGLLVENLTAEQHEEAFDLISDGAQRGDNVGIDEFPSLEDFQELSTYGFMISLRDVQTHQLRAVIVIEACQLSRSANSYLATIYIFTCSQFAQKSFWRDLARLAQKFAVEIQLGYGGCVTSIFSTCVQRLLAFREEGFSITANIHEAGMLESSENDIHSYLLHKDFGLGEIPKMSLDLARKVVDDDCDRMSKTVPKTTSVVPVEHTMRDGRTVVIRNIHPSETDLYYAMHEQEGFGLDEFPTKRFFVEMNLQCSYNFVVVEKTTGSWIGTMTIAPSAYARSKSSKQCDMTITLIPKFTGVGFGTELCRILGWIAHRIGFTVLHSDTSLTNPSAIGVAFNNGVVAVGVLPRGIYLADLGWVDMILVYGRIESFMRKPEVKARI